MDGSQAPGTGATRPNAATLAKLAEDYGDRVIAGEERRDDVARFYDRLDLANLRVLWNKFAHLNPGVDHTDARRFLEWTHKSGAYPYGRAALVEDWNGAVKGRRAVNREAEKRRQRWNQFQALLDLANLGELWSKYEKLVPGAGLGHQKTFFEWALASGAYPHGREALQKDWEDAWQGRRAVDRLSPDPPQQPKPDASSFHPTTRAPHPTTGPPDCQDKALAKAKNLTFAGLLTAGLVGGIIIYLVDKL